MMQTISFIFLVFFGFGFSTNLCPNYIICETSEKPSSCPSGQFFREKVKVHGCCPGCGTLKEEEESCKVSEDCQPALKCENFEICKRDPLQACEFYKRYDPLFNKTKYWNPNCSTDGTYAPKQCKGEKITGKCFCVNDFGERIFGEEEWGKAENMTCRCSRLLYNKIKKGMETTLHCDNLGNFEPFQCNEKACWCANPTTGIPYTIMVPIEMMTLLPCYNRDVVGAQYYRQCDSANRMKDVLRSILRNHGTTEITLTSQKCGFDGSYHRVQAAGEKKRCVFVNNSPLTESFELENCNCNCAYDKHVAELRHVEFLADCHNGNYKNRQTWNEKIYCIDEDGFYYSNDSNDCSLPDAVETNLKINFD